MNPFMHLISGGVLVCTPFFLLNWSPAQRCQRVERIGHGTHGTATQRFTTGPARNHCPRGQIRTHSAPRPVRQVKVSRSDRSSVDEEFWKTAISSAAIPKATIALKETLSLTRLMICFLKD